MVEQISEAQGRVNALCQMAAAVTAMEATAAAGMLAQMVHRAHPQASVVLLTESDQGDWLEPVGWVGIGGDAHDLEDDDEVDLWSQMTMHLYGNVREAVPGLRCPLDPGSASASWALDVTAALAGTAFPRVLLETVVVRDPDGPVSVESVVGGVPVRSAGAAEEFTVDAGAGWSWAAWVTHRDDCLSTASDGARGAVLDAFREPPGGKYVDGREGRGWLTGVHL